MLQRSFRRFNPGKTVLMRNGNRMNLQRYNYTILKHQMAIVPMSQLNSLTHMPLRAFSDQKYYNKFKKILKKSKEEGQTSEEGQPQTQSATKITIESKKNHAKMDLEKFLREKGGEPRDDLFKGKIRSRKGAFGKISSFFESIGDMKETLSRKYSSRKDDDLNQQEKFDREYKERLKKQNEKLDEKAVKTTVDFVVSHLERNMNKNYYDERKAEVFFEKVFALEPKHLLENERFQKFIKKDILLMIQNSMGPETVMNWSKFIVYFNLDDPYLWPAVTGKVGELMKRFHTDQLLVILVNCAHSLSSEASNLFSATADYFAEKMSLSYAPESGETSLTEDDIPKIMTVFGSYQMLKENLVSSISEYVDDNSIFMKFDTLADLTLIFSRFCNKSQIARFLEMNNSKIMSNIQFADDKVFYKFLWSYKKAEAFEDFTKNAFIDSFQENHISYSNRVFIRSLLLLTDKEDPERNNLLYNTIEEDLLNRLRKLSLSELNDILWWSLQQENKSDHLVESIQKEMIVRVNAFNEDELVSTIDERIDYIAKKEADQLQEEEIEKIAREIVRKKIEALVKHKKKQSIKERKLGVREVRQSKKDYQKEKTMKKETEKVAEGGIQDESEYLKQKLSNMFKDKRPKESAKSKSSNKSNKAPPKTLSSYLKSRK